MRLICKILLAAGLLSLGGCVVAPVPAGAYVGPAVVAPVPVVAVGGYWYGPHYYYYGRRW
jgi:uncharacterized membrane protein